MGLVNPYLAAKRTEAALNVETKKLYLFHEKYIHSEVEASK